MTEEIKEQSAEEAGNMLLTVGALLGAGAFCIQSTYKFLECLPDYSWISAIGPIIFAILAYLFVGRIVVWRLFRTYWAGIQGFWMRIFLRGTIAVILALAMLSAATVFSASLVSKSDENCTTYTVFWPTFLPK
jgi:hypothetical protein